VVELTLVDSPSVTVAPRLRGSPTVRALRRPGVVLSTLVVVTVVVIGVMIFIIIVILVAMAMPAILNTHGDRSADRELVFELHLFPP